MKEWKRYLLTAFGFLAFGVCVWGDATFTRVKTWGSGDTLTAADLNAEFDNILTNLTPAGVDDQSTNATAMQATTDPYPLSVVSLPTSLQGEIERQRYVLAQLSGKTYWYQDPQIIDTFNYRKPTLTYVSATTVDIENNTGTANQTKVLFPDGDLRSVTEDTSSANKYRRFLITSTATFNSGTEDSGLASGVTESTDYYYMIYAVKSVVDATKFVLAGSTLPPIQANYAVLNTQFNSNGWVYLGMIRNGDGKYNQGDLVPFTHNGAFYTLGESSTTASTPGVLIVDAQDYGSSSYTLSYSSGVSGTKFPNHIRFGTYIIYPATTYNMQDEDSTYNVKTGAGGYVEKVDMADLTLGLNFDYPSTPGAQTVSVWLYGWYDPLCIVNSQY